MNPISFSSVGTGNYQEWIDTLNIHAPKPRLAPTKPNYTLRRLTESHKQKKKRTLVSQEQNLPQSARTLGPSMRSKSTTLHPQQQELLRLIGVEGVYQNFVYYLLHYGTINQQDEYAPPTLNEDSLADIQRLFEALDLDKDGQITGNDIMFAAGLIDQSYNPMFFRKIDKTRKGWVDLPDLVKAFFPHFTLKRVSTIIQKLSKPPPKVLTTRERIPENCLAEIDSLYKLYASQPGGCTLKNMMGFMTSYQRERSETIESMFKEFDSDGDGVLSLEDYTEMVKYSYPPFKQNEAFVEALETGPVKNTKHPLDKDTRIYFPSIKEAVAPVKPYGASELLAVKAASKLGKAKQLFNRQSRLLHVPPVVKFYGGDPNPNVPGDEGEDRSS